MLLYHKLVSIFSGKFNGYTGYGAATASIRDSLERLVTANAQCFVMGSIAKLVPEELEEIKNYFERTGTTHFEPFPCMAIHFRLRNLNHVLLYDNFFSDDKNPQKDPFGDKTGIFVDIGNGDVASLFAYATDVLKHSTIEAERIEREISLSVIARFSHGLLFNKFSTAPPDMNGLSRQQRRSLGLKKISDVVHIYPERAKPRKSYAVSTGIANFEHTHRFDRSGHFRRIKGIGKDQTGTYGIEGLTWVKNHIVGSDDKPYIPKTRVIHKTNKENEHGTTK